MDTRITTRSAEHTYSSSLRILKSGTALLLLSLSGCSWMSGTMLGDYFGVERTVPENSTADFSNRRTPMLNPGGSAPAPQSNLKSNTPISNAEANAGVINVPSSALQVEGMAHQTPIENANPSSGPQADATGGSLAVPPPLQMAPQSNADIVAQATAATQPGTASYAMSQPTEVASQGATPVPADANGMALANIPAIPDHPSSAQNAAQLNALVNDRAASENARSGLMSDPNATVLTSPKTGQLVANSDAAAPAIASANVQASAPQEFVPPALAEVPPTNLQPQANASAMAEAPSVPSATPPTYAAAGAVPTVAPIPGEPQTIPGGKEVAPGIVLLPPPSEQADNAPPPPLQSVPGPLDASAVPAPDIALNAQNNPAPPPPQNVAPAMAYTGPSGAPVVPTETMASIPPAPTNNVAMATAENVPASVPLEPVHLHPPTSMDDGSINVPAPSYVQGSLTPPAPVHLAPPAMSNGTQTRYLADSRYLERRMRTSDMSDSSDN